MAPIVEGASSVHTWVTENVHDVVHHCARFLDQSRYCLHFAPDSVSSDDADDGQISPRPGGVVRSVEEHITVMAQARELKQTRDHVSCPLGLPALEVRANLWPVELRIWGETTTRCRGDGVEEAGGAAPRAGPRRAGSR